MLFAGDVNGQPDLQLRDLATGSVTWVSAIPEAEYPGPPDLEFSADGRFLVYETGTLVHQVFVFDAQAQASELISGVAGTHSVVGAISGDGRFVADARAGSLFGIGQVGLISNGLAVEWLP